MYSRSRNIPPSRVSEVLTGTIKMILDVAFTTRAIMHDDFLFAVNLKT